MGWVWVNNRFSARKESAGVVPAGVMKTRSRRDRKQAFFLGGFIVFPGCLQHPAGGARRPARGIYPFFGLLKVLPVSMKITGKLFAEKFFRIRGEGCRDEIPAGG